MNKSDLSIQVKSTVEELDACLMAAGIPTDLVDYSDEQVKTVQALFETRKKAKLKSFPEVVEYQKQQQKSTPKGEIAVAPAKAITQPTIGDIPQDAADPLRSLIGELTFPAKSG
ncbi:MAG: hypothetical protein WCD18_06620 [Thermosynechococcaceae cyanobacterium]